MRKHKVTRKRIRTNEVICLVLRQKNEAFTLKSTRAQVASADHRNSELNKVIGLDV